MAKTSQAELEVWLIKNNPQVQHLLQNNQIKDLLLEVYEEGKKVGAEQAEEDDEDEDEKFTTNYSSLLVRNL